jgi:hypothetical protein
MVNEAKQALEQLYSTSSALAPIISRDYSIADYFYERLKQEIQDAEQDVNAGQVVAVYCHLFGGESIRVEDLGYMNPNVLLVYGLDHKRQQTVAMIHINAAQIMMKWEEAEQSRPKRSIGFVADKSDTSLQRANASDPESTPTEGTSE